MKKIQLNKEYDLNINSLLKKVRVLYIGPESVEVQYTETDNNKIEFLKFSIWEMNGFDVSEYKENVLSSLSQEFVNDRPLYKVGDKIIVCDELKTEIKDIKYVKDECRYYFLDENGLLKSENEFAIKKINDVIEKNILQSRIDIIKKYIDSVNIDVKSESIRLVSSHYKLQRGLWDFNYGDKVEKDSWEMAKQHAKLTAEENIKQICINNLDTNLTHFWFNVIKKIDSI